MRAFFTVDVDCDLAWPGNGIPSVTKGKNKPEFAYSEKGLVALVQLLGVLNVKATFFFEARTATALSKRLDLRQLMANHEVACHGLDHEDFTLLSFKEKCSRLGEAKRVLEELFERPIQGFRAPYLKADAELMDALAVEGFYWDSSCSVLDSVLPQLVAPEKLYFWPLIEGKISESDFLKRVLAVNEPVLSTHSWHSVATLQEVVRSPDVEERVIRALLNQKYAFSGISKGIQKLKKP